MICKEYKFLRTWFKFVDDKKYTKIRKRASLFKFSGDGKQKYFYVA